MVNPPDVGSIGLGKGQQGKLKRHMPKGDIFMTELDELQALIEDERGYSKSFYTSGLGVSLTGAPLISLISKIPEISPKAIFDTLGVGGGFYGLALLIFIISATCLIIFWLQSRREKDKAINKIKTIKQQHGYEVDAQSSP